MKRKLDCKYIISESVHGTCELIAHLLGRRRCLENTNPLGQGHSLALAYLYVTKLFRPEERNSPFSS